MPSVTNVFIYDLYKATTERLLLVISRHVDLAENLGVADVLASLGSSSQLILLFQFSRHDPVAGQNRVTIRPEITDLNEVKATKLILQEIAHKVVKSTILARVYIHLSKHFVDLVDRFELILVRTWHALNE